MRPCCLKCDNCGTRTKIIAKFVITKDVETGEYISKEFQYKCKECSHEWTSGWEDSN